MTTTIVSTTALDDLDRQWGQSYDLAHVAARWIAQRLDNGHILTAASPVALDELIAADHAAQPVTARP
jgi:hypothetical protein